MLKMNQQGYALGTIGNICFYEMRGKSYVRKKSSLTRKRVLKSAEFQKTREYAGYFALASRIGSAIYKALPVNIKERWIYRAIAGEAASLLYQGKEETEVTRLLMEKYISNTKEKETINGKRAAKNGMTDNKKQHLQLRELFRKRWNQQGRNDYHFKQAWPGQAYFNPERFRDVLDILTLSTGAGALGHAQRRR